MEPIGTSITNGFPTWINYGLTEEGTIGVRNTQNPFKFVAWLKRCLKGFDNAWAKFLQEWNRQNTLHLA